MTARSFLFVPGNRPERFDAASRAGADVMLIDLEDSVAGADKAAARNAAADWLSTRPAWLRINGVETEGFAEDLTILRQPHLQGVMLAKTEAIEPLAAIQHAAAANLPMLPLIESARGLWNAMKIATAPGVARLAFGSVDYQLDLGIDGEREELLAARSQLVLISRVAGRPAPVDGVTMALNDADALARDITFARRLGFGGKLCVHPRQVAAVNEGFRPTAAEVEWARRVVRAAAETGDNALRLDGKLVDRPVIARARGVLRDLDSDA